MKNNLTLADWLNQVRADLAVFLPDEPLTSLYAILEKNTGSSREWLLANPHFSFDESMLSILNEDVKELKNGKPLAYILGYWDFFGLPFFITPAVLIPRPETELLVETALEILSHKQLDPLVADIGTGSACIATAIAKHQPDVRIVAADISFSALEVAYRNIHRHAVEKHVHLLQTDLLNGLQTRFDLICANLPYIPTCALQELPVARYEPSLALDGGQDGLNIIRRLLSQAQHHLAKHGSLLFEMQFDQAEALSMQAGLHFPSAEVIMKRDLSGHDRLLVIHT
ncbi:MAG: peptide chain release factor N(5)-glutamine methyltransferase [Anaerolineaceae bacterium]